MPSDHAITIWDQANPIRTVVSIEPRRVDYPTKWFAAENDAMDYALGLQKRTGWRLVDRRREAA